MLEAAGNACADSMSKEDGKKKERKPASAAAASLAVVEGDCIILPKQAGGGSEAVSCIRGIDRAEKNVKQKTVRFAQPLMIKKRVR
jgi:hypothetical protein